MQTHTTQSDALLKIWAWVEAHLKAVIWGVMLVIVAIAAIGFYLWHQEETEVNASATLSAIVTRDVASGRPESATAYLNVAEEFPKTDAGGRAILMAGTKLFEAGKYEEAKAQFERYSREHPEGTFVNQALLGAAASLDAQGKTLEAITAYKAIADQHANEFAGAHARLELARLAESQNNWELARSYYSQIARPEFGTAGREADARLRQLILKHPELMSAPPSETNAPGSIMAPGQP